MPYKIIITEIQTATETKSGEWTVISRVPWTPEEVNEKTRTLYGENANDFLKNTPLKEVRGYSPDHEVKTTKEAKIYEQTVETLEMAAIVKAINKL